jgi:hypothetical protein|tara:strand:- start:77 stop:346 length:270 start_codon:yes stop_codon:yes gene_type:complete
MKQSSNKFSKDDNCQAKLEVEVLSQNGYAQGFCLPPTGVRALVFVGFNISMRKATVSELVVFTYDLQSLGQTLGFISSTSPRFVVSGTR